MPDTCRPPYAYPIQEAIERPKTSVRGRRKQCLQQPIGCAKTGVSIAVARPRGYGPDPEAVKRAEEAAETSGASISIVEDPEEAVKGSDAIYTDTFVSMGMEKERERRLSTFIPRYQVNKTLLSHAKAGAIFLHCLPAHRGEEVTE